MRPICKCDRAGQERAQPPSKQKKRRKVFRRLHQEKQPQLPDFVPGPLNTSSSQGRHSSASAERRRQPAKTAAFRT